VERHRGAAGAERHSGEPPCMLALRLSAGARVEAVLHPKPGAVTACRPHPDKAVWDFMVHSVALDEALLEACKASTRGAGDPLGEGLARYASSLAALPLPQSNVGLGEALLLTPLAAALPRVAGSGCEPRRLAGEASRIALSAGPGAAGAYYRLLARLSPSHLGRYEGPVPGVGEGEPRGLAEVLEAAKWDHVHAELLEAYPRSLWLYERIARRLPRLGLAGAALEALLEALARLGDTLILAKWGTRAYLRARREAAEALLYYRRGVMGLSEALEWLDGLWRPRRWSPGAVLDLLAAALGLLLACGPG
jgi:triphosphoribosyl-dephospho-CoA synthetase